MTETAYETLPELESSETRAGAGIVVMKFGGTSVADPEKIRRVAGRLVATKRAGARVVAVVSAMGYHTDELLELAQQVSPQPKPRELDMLISVGERISCALVAMAISDLGTDAVSLTGSQAGSSPTRRTARRKIVEVKAHRIHGALDDDRIVLGGRVPGRLDRVRRDHARPRRLRRPRSRSRPRSAPTRANTPTSTASSRPTRASFRRAEAPCGQLRGDARAGRLGRRKSLRYARSSSRTEPRRDGARALDVHRRAGHLDQGGGRADAGEGVDLGRDAHGRGGGVRGGRVRPADLFEALAAAEVNVDTIIQMDSRIVFSAPVDRAAGRAGTGRARRRLLGAGGAGR